MVENICSSILFFLPFPSESLVILINEEFPEILETFHYFFLCSQSTWLLLPLAIFLVLFFPDLECVDADHSIACVNILLEKADPIILRQT